jgi:hypothetical protein
MKKNGVLWALLRYPSTRDGANGCRVWDGNIMKFTVLRTEGELLTLGPEPHILLFKYCCRMWCSLTGRREKEYQQKLGNGR